ncbi:MAG: hypothetical protein ABIX01_21530 [Chitinophagaceae bacterium]
MFNPTRAQVAFFIAVVAGVIIGKLIKNFKIGFAIAIILGLLLSFGNRNKNRKP